jgi:dipeptidyl aminopeptidase/acylaminoacyl peptidase
VQPNFRGSGGFGRAFAQAGYGQWGGVMQHDVTDAVQHLIDTGVADPSRICIVGASYGGYVALAGAAFTPELYRCVVAIAGVSDLLDSLRSDRIHEGRASPAYQYWTRSMGDPRENRDALIAASPARHAANVRAPVLMVHGEDDSIVLLRQSELMEDALTRAGKQVRLVRLPGGHSWYAWTLADRITLYRELESFLAQHLAQ